jgi:hypothetical protein
MRRPCGGGIGRAWVRSGGHSIDGVGGDPVIDRRWRLDDNLLSRLGRAACGQRGYGYDGDRRQPSPPGLDIEEVCHFHAPRFWRRSSPLRHDAPRRSAALVHRSRSRCAIGHSPVVTLSRSHPVVTVTPTVSSRTGRSKPQELRSSRFRDTARRRDRGRHARRVAIRRAPLPLGGVHASTQTNQRYWRIVAIDSGE